jgi:ornithine carbamoyltransferase
MYNLRNRHFLKEIDFTRGELNHLLRLSAALKTAKYAGTEVPQLRGKEIALVFEKTSTRTRSAFEVAAYDQGAHVTYLDPSGSQMGHKESVADTARVLGRMYDAIEFRGAEQAAIEELAEHAGVPVYNGLTDEWHPTQMLADFLTMYEASRKPYDEISYCFMGDARSNMGRSLLIMGAIMGSDVRICAPRELWPPGEVHEIALERAKESGANLTLTADPEEALPGADFVHTDVWVSMGEPKEVWRERVELLSPYRVTRKALEMTDNRRVKFMHCLPAFHDGNTTVGAEIMAETGLDDGLEVTDEVFSSPRSIVFDQAENRLHTIKAVLVATLA